MKNAKQNLKKYVILLIVLVLASCNSDEKQVKVVAKNYLTAMKDFEYEKAKEFVTTETVRIIDVYAQLFEGTDPIIMDKVKSDAKKREVKILDVKINQDQAEATYRIDDPDRTNDDEVDSDESKKIYLKKTNGKWLVFQYKEKKMDMENESDDVTEELAETGS